MALFVAVAELAERLAGEASRLKKRAAIAEAIGQAHGESGAAEAGLFALYLAGLPFSEADPRKLNAGGALLTRAVLAVSKATDAELTTAYRRHGDLGAAAFDLMGGMSDRAPELKLRDVEEAFAGMAGARTTAVRAGLVEALLGRCTALEAKYLLKLMLGDMRIGVKQSLVEEAIAVAARTARGGDDTTDVSAVRRGVMLEADLAQAAVRAFEGTLGEARMRLFHPLGFMLASPVETPEEAIARFTTKPERQAKTKSGAIVEDRDPDCVEEAIHQMERQTEASPEHVIQAFLEDKYDGMRAQIHCGDAGQPGRVAIYSRNREDITESFPELAEAFGCVKPDVHGAMILDGEILAWDFEATIDGSADGETAPRALPFAVLGSRIGRKKVSNEVRKQVPVVFMAFDLMYADGELLLDMPLKERRNRLERVVERLVHRVAAPFMVDQSAKGTQRTIFEESQEPAIPRLRISTTRLVESAEDIDRAYADARARANEGVMLKATDSAYQPGRRGLAWVKLKRELASLDVVITGAEYGHGRRAAFLSDYTFAVRDSKGELLNVGKAYSGVTDVEIAELTEFLKLHTLEDRGHFRTVEPLVVLEVAFNNVMRSDRHASGFALRFPRILRIRTDKPVDEIDTVERVEQVYLQSGRSANGVNLKFFEEQDTWRETYPIASKSEVRTARRNDNEDATQYCNFDSRRFFGAAHRRCRPDASPDSPP